MSSEIASLVKNCEVCGRYARNNANEPLLQPQVPSSDRVAGDIMFYGNNDYMVVIDAYTQNSSVAGYSSLDTQYLKQPPPCSRDVHLGAAYTTDNIHTVSTLTVINVHKPPNATWSEFALASSNHPAIYIGDFNSHSTEGPTEATTRRVTN
ncbi:hypothetical protein JTB14_037410 [Gonioctena quinquepunctata]|nr:hypothetical protein JTB14_037410 [Gonioctena quinquepunctata]